MGSPDAYVCRAGLDVTDQVRQCHVRLETNQNMRMIGHTVDCQQLLALPGDDAGDVFVQLFFAFGADEVLPTLDGEHGLNIDLCVSVSHKFTCGPIGNHRSKGFTSPSGATC